MTSPRHHRVSGLVQEFRQLSKAPKEKPPGIGGSEGALDNFFELNCGKRSRGLVYGEKDAQLLQAVMKKSKFAKCAPANLSATRDKIAKMGTVSPSP